MTQEARPALADALRRVNERVQRRLSAAVATAGLTLEEWRVLADLVNHPGRPMSAIGSSLLVPAPSLTRIVDRMVDRNWVHRRGDPADRRRVLLYPTARGIECHGRLRAVVAAEEAELAELIGAEAVERLHAALAPVADRLDRPSPAPIEP